MNVHWTGFLVANKVNPAHIEGCWHLGFRVTVTSIGELEKIVERYPYYNCNGELGNHVSFYEKYLVFTRKLK
jgi:hypothetical protein